MAKQLNWGIIGAGGIASTFAENLQYAELSLKHAVGSRSQEKAEAFAAQYGFAYGLVAVLISLGLGWAAGALFHRR